MILLLLPLISSSLGNPCDQIESLRLSPDYLRCSSSHSQQDCLSLHSEFNSLLSSCISHSELLSTSQGLSDFMAGLYNGIQKNAADPSKCVQSFPYIKSSLLDFLFGLKALGVSPLVSSLFNFNLFINRLATTYALCNFATLYQILHPETAWDELSFIFSHWLMEKDQVKKTFAQLFQALNSKNYISGGIYTGKLITLLTSYSL